MYISTDSTLVVIGVGFLCGPINERPEESGISHLLEHMMFFRPRSNKKSIWEELTNLGALMNAETHIDITLYNISVDANHWQKALAIMQQVVGSLDLSESEFNNEKKVVLEEFGLGNTSNTDKLIMAMYADTVYGGTIIGSRETLNAITYDDIVDYHRLYYKNPTFCVLGPSTLKKKVETAMDRLQWKNGTSPFLQYNFIMDINNNRCILSYKNVHFVKKCKKIQNKRIFICFLGFPLCDVRSYMATLAAFILTKRLTKILRKKGMVYGVKCSHNGYLYCGTFTINCNTSNTSVELIVSIIKDEIQKLMNISLEQLQHYSKARIKQLELFAKIHPGQYLLWNLKSLMMGGHLTSSKKLSLSEFNDTVKILFQSCRLGYYIESEKDHKAINTILI